MTCRLLISTRRPLRNLTGARIGLALAVLFAVMTASQSAAQDEPAPESPAAETPAAEADGSDVAADETAEASETPPGEPDTEADDEAPVDPHLLIPIPSRPYRTLVTVGFSGRTFIPAERRARVISDVRSAVHRVWGPMLSATVSENDWLVPGTLSRLERLTLPDVFDRYPESDWDKVLLVVIHEQGTAFHVACREYDPRIQELTVVRRDLTLDSRGVGDLAGRVMRDSFRPALFLETPNPGSDELELLLQAGEIVPPDPEAAQIREGDVLRTFMRHMERRNPHQLRKLQPLNLTYVRVTSFNEPLTRTTDSAAADRIPITVPDAEPDDDAEYVDRSHVRGILISHLPIAPFGQRGRSVQQMAVRQRPAAERSTIQLVLRNRPDRPLVCYRVDKVAKLRWREESELPSVRMVTDRNGRIEIDVDPDHPTFWLYVYSGALLLARVPYAPGLLPEDMIELPDDSIRLGVEGELYLFRDQLVDVVAQRAVYMSLAKKAAAAGDSEGLEDAIKQLDALPGKREFDAALNAVETPAIRRADELNNYSARRKVERLCKAMAESLDAFFATEKQIQQLEEIQKLRETARARNLSAPTE